MATKTRRALSDEISELCDQAGCNEKVAGIHHAQFVDRNWNPHPPRSFIKWWPHGKAVCEEKSGEAWRHVDEVRAYNCETVRQIWTEVNQHAS